MVRGSRFQCSERQFSRIRLSKNPVYTIVLFGRGFGLNRPIPPVKKETTIGLDAGPHQSLLQQEGCAESTSALMYFMCLFKITADFTVSGTVVVCWAVAAVPVTARARPRQLRGILCETVS